MKRTYRAIGGLLPVRFSKFQVPNDDRDTYTSETRSFRVFEKMRNEKVDSSSHWHVEFHTCFTSYPIHWNDWSVLRLRLGSHAAPAVRSFQRLLQISFRLICTS